MELAIDHNDDQKNKHSDDSDGYNPIRSHPAIIVSLCIQDELVGHLYLRAIPRSVLTLLST